MDPEVKDKMVKKIIGTSDLSLKNRLIGMFYNTEKIYEFQKQFDMSTREKVYEVHQQLLAHFKEYMAMLNEQETVQIKDIENLEEFLTQEEIK